MEIKPGPLELLLTNTIEFNKTNLELLKLKSIDKTSDVASTILSRSLLTLAIAAFLFMLTIAISLWLGELMGKTYYGFLVIAGVYGVIGIILFLCHPYIKTHTSNSIIIQMLN
jgi:ABC-type dipeptide/oligopeptide/nickel transport system permease component